MAYWLQHRDHVLLVRRPKQGLLGGMLALPTSEWSDQVPCGAGQPLSVHWEDGGAVEHVFTHFSLKLRLLCAEAEAREEGAIWWPLERLGEAGLPTVFAKVAERGLAWQRAA